MLYYAFTTLAVISAALALPTEESQCPRTVCVDGVNSCGVRYGSCYDACTASLLPTAPSCSVSTSSISTENCSTRTVCADYVNDCGIWYGGCFPDCTPWPTFTAPPCTTTSAPSITPTTITIPPTTDCHTQTICTDYIDDCGKRLLASNCPRGVIRECMPLIWGVGL
ncbi:hypothetical protein BKA67DRAFT_293513 [Truncatella angustata]|uniref:Uncharacterized protein n=1 Tax=Truncatella angustata TaxID=152316 RepID=A0A9P8ZX18_9PEZI|nr:uncharacterized protein BKA67DRAFT_293513 [Truncatella angustata]KAH6652549.1 hypothetical protein BKA67DRAFT_293513 [Truncatella angustata]